MRLSGARARCPNCRASLVVPEELVVPDAESDSGSGAEPVPRPQGDYSNAAFAACFESNARWCVHSIACDVSLCLGDHDLNGEATPRGIVLRDPDTGMERATLSAEPLIRAATDVTGWLKYPGHAIREVQLYDGPAGGCPPPAELACGVVFPDAAATDAAYSMYILVCEADAPRVLSALLDELNA